MQFVVKHSHVNEISVWAACSITHVVKPQEHYYSTTTTAAAAADDDDDDADGGLPAVT